MDEQIKNGQIGEQAKRWINIRMDEQSDRWIDRQLSNKWTDIWTTLQRLWSPYHNIYIIVSLYSCIVMIGLPYPNIKSPELNEKMNYLNSTQVNKLTIKYFCI